MKNNQEILQKLTKTETEILQLYKHNTECKSSEKIAEIYNETITAINDLDLEMDQKEYKN